MHARLTSLILLISFFVCQLAFAQDDSSKGEFASPTIAIGCVVSDIDASIKFYTEAIGFKVARGFKVAPDFATNTGLTNQKQLDITGLKLGDGPGATELKLMQVKNRPTNSSILHWDSAI